MRDLYVVINGQRRGPFNEAKIRAGIKAGKLKEDVELIDAATGDLVLADDLAPPPTGGINYGRQQPAGPPQRRGAPSAYTQNAQQQAAQWNQQPGYGQQYGAPQQYGQQYGAPQPYGGHQGYNPYGHQQQYAPPRPSGTNPGLVPLIISIFCWPIGLIAGIMALKKAKEQGFSEGLSIAAIVVSILGAVLAVIRIGAMAGS